MGTAGEGWTSTGLSEDASKQLKEISKDLGINMREACSIAIMYFARSDAYVEMREEMARILVLKDKYPQLFRALT
jgi:hypothetical protein